MAFVSNKNSLLVVGSVIKVFTGMKSTQCTDKYSKEFTSDGVQNRKTKNWRLGMILTSFQDVKFFSEKYFSVIFLL